MRSRRGAGPALTFLVSQKEIGCPSFRGIRKLGTTYIRPDVHSSQPFVGNLGYRGVIA